MKHLMTLMALVVAVTAGAQDDCEPSPDFNQDGVVGMNDLLTLLSAFGDFDLDFDGIWDSVDDCVGVYDVCGVCGGTGEDVDNDGLCDDVDDCVGAYDECGVCNGPGPDIPVIDEIIYTTDSLFIEPLDEWYVFEFATDTLFTYVCPVSGCTDETAGNYNPEAVIEDGSCVYGPLECGGVSTVTYDGYTYDLVAIGDQCWFAENLRNEHYANGDLIPGDLTESEWLSTTEGAQTFYSNDASNLADYGRLYNWYAVDDARGLCPSDWHVPTDGEFVILEIELGLNETAAWSAGSRGPEQAAKLKSSPADSPSWDGNNTSGFSGLPGGYLVWGNYDYEGQEGFFWTSTIWDSSGGLPWYRALLSNAIQRNHNQPVQAKSVRCLKD